MNPQRATTNIWYVPQKKFNFFPKRDEDDILTAAEKYMEHHGTEAFERMIVRVSSTSHLLLPYMHWCVWFDECLCFGDAEG